MEVRIFGCKVRIPLYGISIPANQKRTPIRFKKVMHIHISFRHSEYVSVMYVVDEIDSGFDVLLAECLNLPRGEGGAGSGRSHEALREVEDPSLIKELLRIIKAICFACDPVT